MRGHLPCTKLHANGRKTGRRDDCADHHSDYGVDEQTHQDGKIVEQWATDLGLSPALLELIVGYATRIVGVILILFAAFVLAGWARSMLVAKLTKVNFDATLTKFVGSMARWAIILFALLGCLGLFGVETTSFAAVIGGASLAIGLAFQGSLSNVAAGVMLLVFRPYKVGDVINVGGKLGKVDTIDLFMTTLDTPDNRRIIVPNGQVFGATIENVTYHPRRRVDVVVGVDYDVDIDTTREILLKAVDEIELRIPDTEVVAFLAGLGGSSVDWQLRFWAPTPDYATAMQQGIRAVKRALDAADIGIPYPHHVIINKPS